MKVRLLCLLAIVLVLPSGTSIAVPVVDASLGVCTRPDEFQKRQEAMDSQVTRLSAEKDTVQRAKLVAALAAAAESDIECLIRYREPSLAPVFAEVAKTSTKWFTRSRALYGIKMLGVASTAPVAIAALDDQDGMVREAAANALGQLGGDAARAALQRRLAIERDAYVHATIQSALGQLDGTVKPLRPDAWKETLTGPPGVQRVAYVRNQRGAPSYNVADPAKLNYPEAKQFSYPIQRYKAALFGVYPRNSFGGKSGHAGEDCGWFREGCSVYAIADGVVRMVQGAGGDFGFLIVIEHRLPDGQYLTSVYGHCAKDVFVHESQVVKAGQRIATQGLSCGIENGGYGSHLHFGLGNGPFRRPPGMELGDTVLDQNKNEMPVLRLGYSQTKKNSAGLPALALVLRKPDGSELNIDGFRDFPTQQEIRWLRPYVKGCRGWLNPQTELPKLVEKGNDKP